MDTIPTHILTDDKWIVETSSLSPEELERALKINEFDKLMSQTRKRVFDLN